MLGPGLLGPGLLGPGPNEPGPHAEADSVERSKKIKNYEFGLLPPTFNAGLVDDQMRLVKELRDELRADKKAHRQPQFDD